MTPVDVPAIDAPAADASDVTAPPSDAADATVDAPADTAVDAPADAPVDTGPADAPPVTRGLCAWNHSDLAAFAVRFSLCSFRAPQEALNTYFNPSNWEGSPLAVRACPALRCVADTSSPGTCGAWLSSCLKYEVARVDGDGGACPTPAGSCEGATPATARASRSRVETRDNCVALGLRCVSSGGEAACVSPLGNACTPGAPARCNGSVLEQCVLGVYTRARDCDLTAGVCDATAGTCRGAGVHRRRDAVRRHLAARVPRRSLARARLRAPRDGRGVPDGQRPRVLRRGARDCDPPSRRPRARATAIPWCSARRAARTATPPRRATGLRAARPGPRLRQLRRAVTPAR